MPRAERLSRDYFARNTVQVARELLGARLVRLEGSQRVGGIILETEAYRGEEDQACHARAGRTPRTQVMYGQPGHAYVYFTYGMHWMLNFVTEAEGYPAAVLIRAILPVDGMSLIERRRNKVPSAQWTDGPAKLCQALRIDGQQHGMDLCEPGSEILVEAGVDVPDSQVVISPRVGLNTVAEPWQSMPWRFRLVDSYYSSLRSNS